MPVTLAVWRLQQPLRNPYRLSFGTLTAFDTLILRLADGERAGFGEITPLPGYSDETVHSALAALETVRADAARGMGLSDQVAGLTPTDPMVASALACAGETIAEGAERFFRRAVPGDLPLAALCDGATPDLAARAAVELQERGYSHLKLKAGGRPVQDDIDCLRAVAGTLGPGTSISVDANQRMNEADARLLCDAAADLPVLLVEQPFPPDAWEAFARLVAAVRVPLMLDESIWTAADVDRAAEVGAAWVKLKLCKHPGIRANHALVERARGLGLGVIYGNGVQGAVGNHLEARIYADAGLDTPGEFNGVLKIADDPFEGRFTEVRGALRAGGLTALETKLASCKPLAEFAFTS